MSHHNTRLLYALCILLVATCSVQSSCSPASFRERADSLFLITEDLKYVYDLKQSEEKHFLPYVLEEISGLTYLPNGNLLCVEDEGGRAYEYNLKTRKIVNAITFSHPGDYEGIEIVNNMVYILESDGDIYEFAYTTEDIATSKKYENALSKENDTEGLGYNPLSGHLLIACKEEEDIKGINAKGKTVYQFDLKTEKLIKQPFFELTVSNMKDFFEDHRDFEYEKERIKFEPSAIAFNPIDSLYYLMASVGKMIVVMDSLGAIQGTYPIAPRVLNQPEGICFAPNGDLYISSEGEGDRGYILKYSIREQ